MDGSVAIVVALTPVRGTAPMWDLTVSQVHDFAVGNGAYVVHNCNRPVNARGEPYPKATDPRTNKPVPFPEGDLKIVPKESRVEWDSPATGFKRRGAYIKEWFDRKLPKLPGSWGDYELHHIWPREYGGN